MLDDIDRECCHSFQQALVANLPKGWVVKDIIFHDPGMTLIVKYPDTRHVGNPTVTIDIRYGDGRNEKI